MSDSLRQFKATMFQALAHPTRIAIVELLRDGELPVATLVERLGVEPANASQHFAILRSRHIITNRKEGAYHVSAMAEGHALRALGRSARALT